MLFFNFIIFEKMLVIGEWNLLIYLKVISFY